MVLLLLYLLAVSARLFSVSDFAYSLCRYGALERPIAFSSLQPAYFLGRWMSSLDYRLLPRLLFQVRILPWH